MSSVNASGAGCRIPRIIHQIWIQGENAMPRRYRDTTSTWARRNPGWTHRVWDEVSLRELLFGDRWWRIYAAQPELEARADVARYALLQRFGGLYADIDTECRRPIESMLSGRAARLYVTAYSHPRPARTRFADVTNSILASTPAHPLWDAVLLRLEAHHDATIFVTARTGPRMLSCLIEQHASREPDDVHLLRFPQALTTAMVPVLLMRAFSRLRSDNRILDFNDAGRNGVRRFAQRTWRIATLRG